jgi:DNA-binding Lrp family transcriptional regulator
MEFYPDYILIPFQIINDKKIEPVAEKLYGLIYWYVSLGQHKCFVSNIVLSKLLNVTPRTIQNSLDALEKAGYIKRIYKDESRRHRVQIFPLVTFKTATFQTEMAVIPEKQTETKDTLDGNGGDHIKNTIKNKRNTEQSSDRINLKEEIEKMENNDRRDLNIIALYFEQRKPDLQTKGQLQVAIRRHLRAAGQLKCFDDQQILAAVPKAKKITNEWTIDTLVKVLTK